MSAIPVTDKREQAYKPDDANVDGEIPSPQNVPSGCRLHPRCPHSTEQCAEERPTPCAVDSAEVRCLAYEEDASGFEGLRTQPSPVASDGSGSE